MSGLTSEAVNQLRQDARSVVRELGLLNDAYYDIGVTLAERHLLIELSVCPPLTMGEIAARLLLDKSTVSRLIGKAERKGYLNCVADEKDKRKRILKLTEKGKETLQAFEPIAFHQTKEALSTLTGEEVRTVYQGVALYARGLKSSRLKDPKQEEKRIESLPEIFKRLKELGFDLKPFAPQDEAELYQIFKEVVDTGSQFPYECSSIEEFRRQFFSPQQKVYVCHSLNGMVVGGFYIKQNYSGRSGHIANAAYMIREDHRGRGIGTLLIKASLHLANELGFRAMQFNMVLSQNTLAVQLYERLGFAVVGTLPQAVRNPDGSYQDGYVMHRALDL